MDPSSSDALALLASLRSGRLGFAPRVALSVAAAAVCLAGLMFVLGAGDQSGRRIQDEHVFAGLAVAAACWIGLLYLLWASYGRWRRILSTVFLCLIAVIATTAASTFVAMALPHPEFFIAGAVLAGAGSVIGIVAASTHQASRGRALLTQEGAIDIRCPACGYSLAGLHSCACPECGRTYPLDELIRAQGYEALRAPRPAPAPFTRTAPPALPATPEHA